MNRADADDFYEDDEPVADVLAAFEAGAHGVTARPSLRSRVIRRADTLAHKLHLPFCGLLCDSYDLSLGITRDDLRRKAP